jgi:hypothetical protein
VTTDQPATPETPESTRHGLVGVLVVVGAYVVSLALFAPFAVAGDGTFYYALTQRLVGEGGSPSAYQWATSLWNAPFYLLGHAIGLPYTAAPPFATGDPFRDASITVAAGVAALGAVFVARYAVRQLGLPANTILLLGALFGTELWFYGVIEPSYTHAVDALAFSVAAALVVRLCRGASTGVPGALGMTLAALVAIRYANVAALPGFVIPVIVRRDVRQAVAVLGGAVAGAVLLLAVPLALGLPFGSTAFIKAGRPGTVSHASGASVSDLLIPLRMLFAPDRGLLVYAPLCGVALVGFGLAIASTPRIRVPLVSIGLASLGVLLVYTATGVGWRGGSYAYGQRFLTSLTVITLIGLAELYRRRPRLTAVVVVLCTIWSLFIGLNYTYGWEGVTNDRRNADEIVRLYASGERTPWGFARIVVARLEDRFTR